jgi:ferric-dicitrate binding protein FerR (iron transport regulator)
MTDAMTTARYARAAGRLLGREPRELGPPSFEDRARAIEAVAAALRAKGKRRRLRLRLVAATAVAAALAAVAVGLHASRGSAPVAAAPAEWTVERAPSPFEIIAHPSGDGAMVVGTSSAPLTAPLMAPLMEGESLAPGSRIVARPGGHAILAFSTGTRLTVEDGGDVTLVDSGPTSVIALSHGVLRADVAKLQAHERFLVRTDDAEIEVRGTSFRVQVAGEPCAAGATRVDVYEGVVVVRSRGDETRVAAGESFSPACASSREANGPVTSAQGSHPAAASGAAHPPPASSLGAQNDLFGAAVSAKQSGNTRGAIDRFDAFVTRYPSSPLAESAAVQRMKLLRGLDGGRAAAAARAYLARWPDGFGRAEAEAIVAGAR